MTSLIGLRSAQSFGLLGLLPFFALAMFAWLPPDAIFAGAQAAALSQRALVGYAAVIVSFLGAVHWGFALMTPSLARTAMRQSLLWGVVATLLGWLALLMMLVGIRPRLVLLFLIGDLLLCRLMDGALLPHYPAAPGWYLELRTRLTIGASLALAFAVPATS